MSDQSQQQSEETKRGTLTVEEATAKLTKAMQSAAPAAPTAEPEQQPADPDETTLGTEESDAGGSDDDAAAAEAGDGEDEDLDAKDPLVEVTINGEVVEVRLSELISGYQRHGDYTKKTQALADQRRAVEQQAKEAQALHATLTAEQQRIAKEREQYDAALQALQGVLTEADKEYANLDWEKLWEEDPAEAGKLQHRFRQHEQRKRDLLDEQKRREEERKREEQEQHAAAVKQFQAAIAQHFPQWADQSVRAKDWESMYKTARTLDFSDEEIRTTVDPRIFRLLHKAMQSDRAAATKQSAANPARVPAKEPAKVVQPGGARPTVRAGSNGGSQAAWKSFAKKPGIDAATAYLQSVQRAATKR